MLNKLKTLNKHNIEIASTLEANSKTRLDSSGKSIFNTLFKIKAKKAKLYFNNLFLNSNKIYFKYWKKIRIKLIISAYYSSIS